MLLAPYLAMTAAEFRRGTPCCPIGWMACHFSLYGTGLSNLPRQLPEGSLLIVNDRIPIQGHDPDEIARQLGRAAEDLNISGILLDFQRPGEPETAAVVSAAAQLPCPVGVSSVYAEAADCAVFLPPVPLATPLDRYLAPWDKREIWLELAANAQSITITREGSRVSDCPTPDFPLPHTDNALNCAYGIDVLPEEIRFTLYRKPALLPSLMEKAQGLGVTRFVGLYQDLGSFFDQKEAQATARDHP